VTDCSGLLLSKLASRGWRSQPHIWPEEEDGIQDAWLGRSDFGPRGTKPCRRRFGDRLSWIIPLPMDGIECPKTPDSVLEYSEFGIKLTDGDVNLVNMGDMIPRYELYSRLFRSLVLRYTYTYTHDLLLTFGDRLENLTRLELLKIEASKRPPTLMIPDIFSSFLLYENDFDRPESWTYYDEELPGWVDRMESLSRGRMKNYSKESDMDA
jgi:hypothetical protein